MFQFIKNIFKKKDIRASSYIGNDAWIKYLSNNSSTGKIVTEDDALTLSSVWRGINLLANGVAMLPIFTYKKLPNGGKEQNSSHPLWYVLRFQPNPLQDSFQFFHTMVSHLVLRGNSYNQIIRNGRNDISELYPLNPDYVTPFWEDVTNEESLKYKVSLPSGLKYVLEKSSILHIRTMSVNGITGVSPLTLAAQSIGIGISQEEHVGAFYGRGTRATGILKHPAKISAEAATRLRESFEKSFSGSDNAYRTIVLEEGLEWQQVTPTPEQSQMIESREMTITEFARWLGVPPHMLYDLRRATFTNIEHQNLEFYQNSLSPYVISIERAMTRQLLRQAEWDSTVIEFLIDSVLRADTKSRYEAYNIARNGGWLNVDEIRSKENMNPLPENKGQIYLEPLNMKEAGTQDTNTSKSQDAPDNKDTPTDTQEDISINSMEKSWEKIFRHRISRAIRREITLKERKNFSPDKMKEYIAEDFKNDIEAYLIFRLENRNILLKNEGQVSSEFLAEFSNLWTLNIEKIKENISIQEREDIEYKKLEQVLSKIKNIIVN